MPEQRRRGLELATAGGVAGIAGGALAFLGADTLGTVLFWAGWVVVLTGLIVAFAARSR